MKKVLFIIVLICAAVSAMTAQTMDVLSYQTVDHTKGYNRVIGSFAMLNAKSDLGESEESDNGVRFGYLRGIQIYSSFPVYFAVGIDGTYVSNKQNGLKEKVLKFCAPIQVSLRLGKPEFNFEPFVGLHGKLNAIGKIVDINSGKEYSYYESGTFIDDDYIFKRVQLGVQFGGGINYNDIYLGYEFRHDLTVLQEPTNLKNYAHLITLGLYF